MKFLLSFLCLIAIAGISNAETTDEKLLKLQAANDALTLRVAELLQENRRLQNAVQEALQAQKSGVLLRQGCDTSDLQRAMAMVSSQFNKNRAAMTWLKSNGEKCSRDQLTLIITKLPSWGNDEFKVWTADSISLARFYLEN